MRGGSLAQIGNAAIYGAGLFAILRNSLPFLKEEYVYRLMKGKEWVDKNYPSRSMGYMGFMAGTTIGLVEGGLSALFTHYCLP